MSTYDTEYDFSQHPQYPGVITRFDGNRNAYGVISDVKQDLVEQLSGTMGRAQAVAAGDAFRDACFTMGSYEQLIAFCEYTVRRLP